MSVIVSSSPSMLQTLRYRTRPPSSRWTWCSVTSCSPVAPYSLTGTFTSPKATEPFQIARIFPTSWPHENTSVPRCGGSVSPDGGPGGSPTNLDVRPLRWAVRVKRLLPGSDDVGDDSFTSHPLSC